MPRQKERTMPRTMVPAIGTATTRLDGDLRSLVERRMLSPARERGYELALVGATVLPQRQEIARTEWGTWLFVDHVEDPTADADGHLPVPGAELQRLHALAQAG